jgi:hypothetical protein
LAQTHHINALPLFFRSLVSCLRKFSSSSVPVSSSVPPDPWPAMSHSIVSEYAADRITSTFKASVACVFRIFFVRVSSRTSVLEPGDSCLHLPDSSSRPLYNPNIHARSDNSRKYSARPFIDLFTYTKQWYSGECRMRNFRAYSGPKILPSSSPTI